MNEIGQRFSFTAFEYIQIFEDDLSVMKRKKEKMLL